jgi:Uri superfamily endonuclease
MENKYESSKIYKLICNEYYYIGSTIQPLKQRLYRHKSLANSGTNHIYQHLNDIGWDNVTIELVENYPCQTKNELNDRLAYHELLAKDDTLCLNFMTVNNYTNGKIYKLVCTDGHFYIGSTTQLLPYRLYHHKESAKKGTSRAYQYINSIGWDNVHIELIEDYPCNTMKELHEREDMYIQLMQNDDNCLNENRAHLLKEEKLDNMKQYYQEHKEEITEYQEKYRAEHNETINQKFAEYRKKNAELLAEKQRAYAQQNKEKIKTYKKTYDETHKEELAETYRIYRLKNKEKIVKRQREWAQKKKEENAEVIAHERAIQKQERQEKSQKRIDYDNIINTCECGGTYQNYRKSRHLASKKHLAFMNNS